MLKDQKEQLDHLAHQDLLDHLELLDELECKVLLADLAVLVFRVLKDQQDLLLTGDSEEILDQLVQQVHKVHPVLLEPPVQRVLWVLQVELDSQVFQVHKEIEVQQDLQVLLVNQV